jgi:hypothetical protein
MSRRRDPAVTGIVHLPWRSVGPCPCGSGRLYGECCQRFDGSPYRKIAAYKPLGPSLGPSTRYSHPRCYMNWTENCSTKITGEHFISENVLSILNPSTLRIGGVSWIPKGETRDLPLGALQANVLCDRHNSALSPLDATAGKFFRALAEIYGDLNHSSLSRKPIWHLFGGEELELWLLKTILGFFYAGALAKDGKKVGEVQTIMNPAIEAAYRTGRIVEPCGVYVFKSGEISAQLGSLDFVSLSDESAKRIVGGRLTMMGLVITFFTDPNMLNRNLFTADHSYRPDYLFYSNGRRRHAVVLTWPPRPARSAVVFTMNARRRK